MINRHDTFTRSRLVLGLASMLILGTLAFAVDPVVSNVVAQQRNGTKLVDISYTLTDADSASLNVSIKISKDGGTTWNVPCPSLSGNGIGSAVAPGSGKQIAWDAGTDRTRMPER